MHILIIPSWYATPSNPIRGSFFREQALALKKRGHQVGMLIPPSKMRTWHGLSELQRFWRYSYSDLQIDHQDDIATYRMPWWGWQASVNPFKRGDLGLEVFDRYCAEQGQPDVLHGHSILYGGYLAAYWGQQRHIPSVLTEHSTLFDQRRSKIMPGQVHFIRYTLEKMRRNIAVAAPLAESLKRYVPDAEITVIGNLVDVAFFKAQPPPTRPPFVFTVIGRLVPHKAHRLLLQAFAQAFAQQDVRLLVVGDGSERSTLEGLCKALNIDQQVQFLGLVSRGEVRDILERSHALVSPSDVETFGVTLIEAMACGRPIVSTFSGGPDEVVTPTTGLLVPTQDVDALAAALRTMIKNYSQYNSEKIRAECVARFSEDSITTRLETIYTELINGR